MTAKPTKYLAGSVPVKSSLAFLSHLAVIQLQSDLDPSFAGARLGSAHHYWHQLQGHLHTAGECGPFAHSWWVCPSPMLSPPDSLYHGQAERRELWGKEHVNVRVICVISSYNPKCIHVDNFRCRTKPGLKNKKMLLYCKHSKLGFLRPVSIEVSKVALGFCLWIWTKKRNP